MIARGTLLKVNGSSIGCFKSFTAPARMQKFIDDSCINQSTDRVTYRKAMYEYDNLESSVEYAKADYATLVSVAEDDDPAAIEIDFKDGGKMTFNAHLEKFPIVGSAADATLVSNTSWKIMSDLTFVTTGSSLPMDMPMGVTAEEMMRI